MASSLGNRVSSSGLRLANDQGVLDADTAAVGQVDTGFHGHHGASKQCTGGGGVDSRRFVDLQTDAVTEAVAEVLGVAGVGDDLAGGGVDLAQRRPRPRAPRGRPAGRRTPARRSPAATARRRAEHEGAGHVGVVAADQRTEVDLDEVTRRQHRVGRPVMRDRRVGAGRHDGLERRSVGAVLEHQRLQLAADLPLGAARPQAAAGSPARPGRRRRPRTPAAAARPRRRP